MKKMTSSVVFSSLLFLFSCAQHENNIVENLEAVQAQTEEYQEVDMYLNGPSVYLAGAEANLIKIQIRKRELITEIENGNDKAAEELERNQNLENNIEAFKKHMLVRLPRMPRKPKGCKNPETNCRIDMTLVMGFTQHEAFKLKKIEIRDAKNEKIALQSKIMEDGNGNSVLAFESDSYEEATLLLTIESEIGETLLEVPVSHNR